ncbi:MAG: glycoside hydrolase family 38 N-terminal domain-containing protein [Candidatus Aminicenantales bacterium]
MTRAHHSWRNILTAAVLVAGIALPGPAQEKSSPSVKPTPATESRTPAPAAGALSIISSSHQDIAWMNSPEKCVEFRDKNVITPALALLAKDPSYAFTMENMLNLMEYLERHPDKRDEITRFTREGRMEWGATFNQPYESLLSGEQLIRETYFGRRWIKKNFTGCDARVYFNPDVPGRSMQMPQILAKAGIPYMVMSRYHEGYYRWASPDGTSVLAYSPGHYGNAAAYLNAAPAEGAKAIAEKVAKWKDYHESRSLPPQFPLLNSVDFSQPTDFRPLINLWNGSSQGAAGVPLTLQYSSARRFFEALDVKGTRFETITGERPNLWLYIHGPTHHWAISAERQAGRLLPAAETFSTFRALLEGSFKDYPAARFEAAWMAAIYPDHGWGGKEGQITDRLFRKKYEFARDEGREILNSALTAIAGRVRTQPGKGTPVIIFNALSWVRTDPVVCEVEAGNAPFRIADGAGNEIAYQVLPASAGQRPGTVRIEFIAADVPGLGYKTLYIVAGGREADKTTAVPRPAAIENAFYRIELAPGGVKSIFDKELGREILNSGKFLGFEVFTMQSVGNGAGEFGRVQQPTMAGFDRLGLHGPAWKFSAAESGSMRTVFTMDQPLKNCAIREKLVVWNDIKRIDCEVDILRWDGDPYREFRIAVPVGAQNGRVAYEVPLGVVEVGKSEIAGTGGPAYGNLVYDELCSDIRPREVQNFICGGDDAFGVTLSTSVAVCDFKDPTDSPVPYPVLQPILLASRRSCHGEGNWYLQEGDHHYSFSLTSHGPGWRNGYKQGIQPNNPLIALVNPAAGAGASLPESTSFLSLSAPNVLLSTLKKAEDDDSLILRVYDIEGKDAEAQLSLFVPVKTAAKVNIIEEEGTALKPAKGDLSLKVGHHAIETFRLISEAKRK